MAEVFNRVENKYVFKEEDFKKFIFAIEDYVKPDPNCIKDGEFKTYVVSSIYYDTPEFMFFNEKLTKQKFRQKLRLRSYNDIDLDTLSYLEIKKNIKGVIDKRRIGLSLDNAYDVMNKETNYNLYRDFDMSQNQILEEVLFLKDFYRLEPKFVLSYDRLAFKGIYENDLRITFDHKIRVRYDDLKLESGSYGDIILPEDEYLCEIKVVNRVPLHIVDILSELKSYKRSYSKFYNSMSKLFQENIV